MEEFVENFYSLEYSGNLHSTDETNDNDDEENNDDQAITLEMEDMEDKKDEPEQNDLEFKKNLDISIIIYIEQ